MADSLFGGEPEENPIGKRYGWVRHVLDLLPDGFGDEFFTLLETAVGNSEAHELLLLIAMKSPAWPEITQERPRVPGVSSPAPSFRHVKALIRDYHQSVRCGPGGGRVRGGMGAVPEDKEVDGLRVGENVSTLTAERVEALQPSTWRTEGSDQDEEDDESEPSIYGSRTQSGSASASAARVPFVRAALPHTDVFRIHPTHFSIHPDDVLTEHGDVLHLSRFGLSAHPQLSPAMQAPRLHQVTCCDCGYAYLVGQNYHGREMIDQMTLEAVRSWCLCVGGREYLRKHKWILHKWMLENIIEFLACRPEELTGRELKRRGPQWFPVRATLEVSEEESGDGEGSTATQEDKEVNDVYEVQEDQEVNEVSEVNEVNEGIEKLEEDKEVNELEEGQEDVYVINDPPQSPPGGWLIFPQERLVLLSPALRYAGSAFLDSSADAWKIYCKIGPEVMCPRCNVYVGISSVLGDYRRCVPSLYPPMIPGAIQVQDPTYPVRVQRLCYEVVDRYHQ